MHKYTTALQKTVTSCPLPGTDLRVGLVGLGPGAPTKSVMVRCYIGQLISFRDYNRGPFVVIFAASYFPFCD